MSKKYKEIMDQVCVTDEMKQRILQNVKNEMEAPKISRSHFLSYGKFSRYISAAACILMLLVGGLTVTKLFDREVMPNESAGDMASGEGQGVAMAVNGMEVLDSAEELSRVLGFPVTDITEIPFEVQNTEYTNGWNEFAQIVYQGENSEILFRKARGANDISGDYNTYEDVKTITINHAEVTLKGESESYSLAIWQQDGFSYSLSMEPCGSEEVFAKMIQSIQ